MDHLERLVEPLEPVIDDLHALDSDGARPVVLATPEEPGLGLHRLGLAGELTELRRPSCASGHARS